MLAVPLAGARVLSYSRASILNIIAGCIVLPIVVPRRKRLLRAGAMVVISATAASLVLIAVFPTFFEAYLARAAASLDYFAEAPNAVLSGRLQTWSRLADFASMHPLRVAAGVGYKTLPYSTITGATAITDNTYVSVLMETGIAGFAALLSLNAAVLAFAYRAARSGESERAFAGVWLFCFWAGQVVQMLSADLLTYWRVLPAYFCVLALAGRDATHQ